MISSRKTIPLVLAILAALVAAGCGGGGGGTTEATATTTEEAPLTKAELISKGDAVCAEVNAAVGALTSSEAEAAVGGEAEKVANLYADMVQGLRNLGAPQGGEAAYARLMEAAEELAKVEGEVKLAAEREDVAALEEAKAKAGPALEEFQSEASAYGFEACAEGPRAPTGVEAGAGGEEIEGGEEEGGVEAEPEYEEPAPEEAAPEEAAPETGGAGGGGGEVAPEGGGGGETGGSSGGVGPG